MFGSRHRPFWFWLFAAVIFASDATARAQLPITSLAGCGKITRSGLYNLDRLNIGPVVGDCIIVAATNVVLNLNGAAITGVGSGAGVHVTSRAGNTFIEGRGASINGFSNGIEIDASKVAVENLIVSSNTAAGLLLNSASQAVIANITATANTDDGIRVFKGSNNTISGSITVTSNGRYGLWLFGTSYNNVGGFLAEDNVIAGVYAGCSSNGPIAAPCKRGTATSKGNSIFDGSVQASSPGSQTYGVFVDVGNDSNRITNISSPSPYEKYDLNDANPECAHNAWFGHGVIFSSTPLDCIH